MTPDAPQPVGFDEELVPYLPPLRPAEGCPRILAEDATAALFDLIKHPKRFKELHGTHLLGRREARLVIARNPGFMRAMFRVLCVFVWRSDLITCRVGTPRSDSFQPGDEDGEPQREKWGADPVRHMNGIGQLWEDSEGRRHGFAVEAGVSIHQLRRVIGELLRLGWITFSQRVVEYRSADGQTKHYACRAIYTLTAKFWDVLRLGPKMEKERRKACERNRGRHRYYALRAPSSTNGRRRGRRTPAPAPVRPPDEAENFQKRFNAAVFELMREHEDWPPDRLRAEARRRALK